MMDRVELVQQLLTTKKFYLNLYFLIKIKCKKIPKFRFSKRYLQRTEPEVPFQIIFGKKEK